MTTKDKLEFALLLGRHSSATVQDCVRLLRFAGTLKRLTPLQSGLENQPDNERKRIRIQRKVLALCTDTVPRFGKDGSLALLTSQGDRIAVPA